MFYGYDISVQFKGMKFSKIEFKSVAQAQTAIFQQAFICTDMFMYMSKWELNTDVNNATHTATYIPGSLIIHNTTLHSQLTAWSFTIPPI